MPVNGYLGPLLFNRGLAGLFEQMLNSTDMSGLKDLDATVSGGMKMPMQRLAGGGVGSMQAGNRQAMQGYNPARQQLTMSNMLNKDFAAQMLGDVGMSDLGILGNYYQMENQGMSNPGSGSLFESIGKGIF